MHFTKETLWEDQAPVWVNWANVVMIVQMGNGAVEIRFVSGPAIWVKGDADIMGRRLP